MYETEKLIKILKKCKDLPMFKSLHAKISDIAGNQDDISLSKISAIINRDVSSASKILKIVNSPFYGFAYKISNIDRAIVLLGLNTVKSILIGMYVFNDAENTMKGLLGHSIFCAMTAKALAADISSGHKLDIDGIFAAGLIHDIGRVFIATAFPDDFRIIKEKVRAEKRFFMDVEKEVIGVNHDIVGSTLLKEWSFPESIYAPIKYHHAPVLNNKYSVESVILNISDILTNAMGVGFAGDYYVEPIKQECLDLLSIDENFFGNFIREVYPYKEELSILEPPTH